MSGTQNTKRRKLPNVQKRKGLWYLYDDCVFVVADTIPLLAKKREEAVDMFIKHLRRFAYRRDIDD